MPPRGPGGPGPGRGPGPGGPRRGFGGMPLSRSGRPMINGHVLSPFAAPSGGATVSGEGTVETFSGYYDSLVHQIKFAIDRKGVLKGTLIGVRHIVTNGFHSALFRRKIKIAEKLFRNEKIDERQYKIRQTQAAYEYFNYLYKIGYYGPNDAMHAFKAYASKIGVELNENDVFFGRSR